MAATTDDYFLLAATNTYLDLHYSSEVRAMHAKFDGEIDTDVNQ